MKRRSAAGCLLAIGMAAAAWAQTPPATSQPTTTAPDAELKARLEGMTVDQLLAEAARLCEVDVDYQQASVFVTAARNRGANTPELLIVQGEMSLGLGDLAPAREAFRLVYGQFPNDFRANLGLGRLYMLGSYWALAAPYLETAAKVAAPDKASEAFRLLAECYRGEGRFKAAVEKAKEAAAGRPSDYQTLMTLVGTLNDDKQFETAATEAQKLHHLAEGQVKAAPADAKMLQRLLDATGIYEQAVRGQYVACLAKTAGGASLDLVVKGKEPDAAAALHKLIDLLQLEADLSRLMTYHRMVEFGERLVKLAPDNPDYWWQYALMLRETRQNDAAVEALRTVLKLRPGDAGATHLLEDMGASATPPATSAPAAPPAGAAS